MAKGKDRLLQGTRISHQALTDFLIFHLRIRVFPLFHANLKKIPNAFAL